MNTIPQMNHEEKDISKVFGLTFYQKHYLNHIIAFSVLSNKMLVDHLFGDDPESAPADLSTFSACLEKALKLTRDQKERDFMLMVFQTGYHAITFHTDILEYFAKMEERGDENKIDKKLKKLLNSMGNPLEKSKKCIRDADYDFEKYIAKAFPPEAAEKMQAEEEDKDLNDLLDNIKTGYDFDQDNEEDDYGEDEY